LGDSKGAGRTGLTHVILKIYLLKAGAKVLLLIENCELIIEKILDFNYFFRDCPNYMQENA
jgi:hypothetical protein